MNLFNSIIMRTVSYLPKSFAKPFAKPYVAGETIEEALSNVKILNQKGFCATLDILGEHVKSKTFTKNITQQYCALDQQINENKLHSILNNIINDSWIHGKSIAKINGEKYLIIYLKIIR